jgi:hypothetical protein
MNESNEITNPNAQRFLNVSLAFHRFAELFDRPEMVDQLKERVLHENRTPKNLEDIAKMDPGWHKLKRITRAVELYAQECFGVDWAGKQVSFHKFAELFERKDAMDKLMLRGKDPRGMMLMRLMALVNAYARDCFGEDLQLMVGEVK